MKFLRNWLRVDRPPGVAINPSRTLELDAAPAQIFEQAVTGIEQLLGGHIAARNPDAGSIEAVFGLVNSERLNVTIRSLGEDKSRVTIESRRGAIAQQPGPSSYVDALAQYLERH